MSRSRGRLALANVAQCGVSACTPKGCGFNFQSGHMTRLQVQSPVGEPTRGNLLKFLCHIDVSLSLKEMKKCPWMRIKEKEKRETRRENGLSNTNTVSLEK